MSDLDAAVPFYEGLANASASRFTFGSAALASIGSSLLFADPGEDGDRLANVADKGACPAPLTDPLADAMISASERLDRGAGRAPATRFKHPG